jgi:2-polyprenyl-6-hydroxyphenyl methylase/3-demethylubiquinone-9 3-methyltransferase
MRKPSYDDSWPEFFKQSYRFDELELWGGTADLGYSYAYANRRQPILDAVRRLVPPGGAVLDVAGAGGNFSLPVAEMGYRVVWNDFRPACMDWVKEKYEFGEIDYVTGNIFDLCGDFRGHFDGVIATEVIEHVAHPDRLLASLASMLKPGGRIFLTTPNGRYFRSSLPKFSDCPDASIYESIQFGADSDGHIFLLHAHELADFARDLGLEIEHLAFVNNPLTCGHVKLGKLLPAMPRGLVSRIETLTRWLPAELKERLHCTTICILSKAATGDALRVGAADADGFSADAPAPAPVIGVGGRLPV